MRIDYSLKPESKYFLFADVPFRQAANHIGLVKCGGEIGLSLTERIKHLAFGAFKLIPVLGHLVATIDTLSQRKSITQLKLESTEPFARGEEHGTILKMRIKEVYDPILKMKRTEPIQQIVNQLENQIPDGLKEEMKGLAQGSGYSYEDVLFIHAFVDALPGAFGCTSMAVKGSGEKCQRIAAANHSVLPWRGVGDFESVLYGESRQRQQALLEQPILENVNTKVLKSAGKKETIQAMVFDTSNGEIYLSAQGSHAANQKFTRFGPDSLFYSNEFETTVTSEPVRLYRNLDWPWYFLGQETVVLTRCQPNGNSTVSISFPGFIGSLSGINNNGLALAANQCDFLNNDNGIPNLLLFTEILDKYTNIEDAGAEIENVRHASSMNLILADRRSARSYELTARESYKVDEINE